MERLQKTFSIVTRICLTITLTVAVASVLGIVITGFYPGIPVLLLLTLIPLTSKFYVKKIKSKSTFFQPKYYRTLSIINLLTILVALWMTFVILVDRVFGNLLG